MGIKINTNQDTSKVYKAQRNLNKKTKSTPVSPQLNIESISNNKSSFSKETVLNKKTEKLKLLQQNINSLKVVLFDAEEKLNSIKDLQFDVKSKVNELLSKNLNETSNNEIREIGKKIDSIIVKSEFNNAELNNVFKNNDLASIDYYKYMVGDFSIDSSLDGEAKNIHKTVKLGLESILVADLKNINIEDFEITIHKALGSIGNTIKGLNQKNDSLFSSISNSKASVSRLFDAETAIKLLDDTISKMEIKQELAKSSQLSINFQRVYNLLDS